MAIPIGPRLAFGFNHELAIVVDVSGILVSGRCIMIHVEGDLVEFRFRCPESEFVHLAGDFNNWSIRDTPMALVSDEVWRVVIRLEPGDYRFRYFTSHRGWMTDWAAFGVERNPFGGWNSVVHVPRVIRATNHCVSPTDAQVEPAPDEPHLRLRSVGSHLPLVPSSYPASAPDAGKVVHVGQSLKRKSVRRG